MAADAATRRAVVLARSDLQGFAPTERLGIAAREMAQRADEMQLLLDHGLDTRAALEAYVRHLRAIAAELTADATTQRQKGAGEGR